MKKIIHTDQAPAAVGTYSQAVDTGNLVFISGQVPLDPASKTLIKGQFSDRVHQVFLNLKAICEAAGGSLDDIVKLNVFLLSMENFAVLNKVMSEYFSEPYPARAAVAVAELPLGTDVEMEAVMQKPI